MRDESRAVHPEDEVRVGPDHAILFRVMVMKRGGEGVMRLIPFGISIPATKCCVHQTPVDQRVLRRHRVRAR